MSTHCEICNAILNPHNITGLCAECKWIARQARAGFICTDNVTSTEAAANVRAVFGGALN